MSNIETKKRVVVTGLGAVTPIGMGIEDTWESLMARRSAVRPIETFDASSLDVRIAAELPALKVADFAPKNYRKNAKVMARDTMIAVACAYHAVRDAGLNTKCIIDRHEATGESNIDSTRFGVNIGAGLINADLKELAPALGSAADAKPESFSLTRWGELGMNNLTPLWLLKFLPNMLACHVTIVHDAQAPSNTITCAEASSHLAIGEAFRTIARGDADVCLCGGSESKLNPMAALKQQLSAQAVVGDQDDPTSACQPFGLASKGCVISEGGCLVVLESLEHAKQRSARIYAEVSGFGASNNTFHWNKPDPTGKPAALAIGKAIKDAGSSIDQFGLVNPFGMGVEALDKPEALGWNEVFGDHLSGIPAMITRGAIGNNGAGTGAIDFAVATMSLYRATVPPSLNTSKLAPYAKFKFATDDPTDLCADHAITLGYAPAGGQHAALVLKQFKE